LVPLGILSPAPIREFLRINQDPISSTFNRWSESVSLGIEDPPPALRLGVETALS